MSSFSRVQRHPKYGDGLGPARSGDQQVYPAIDIFKSGTRREELLIPANDLEKINTIRRGLAGHRPVEAIERLLSFLRKFPTNGQMLREIPG